MPDYRKSYLIFHNFLGEAPRPPASARAFGALFGLRPISKIPGFAPAEVLTKTTKKRKIFRFGKASEAEICTRVRCRYLTSFAGLHFEN